MMQSPRRSRPVSPEINDSSKSLTRSQIQELYSLHRRGKLTGPEWDRIEQQIIQAGREGRILSAVDPHGK